MNKSPINFLNHEINISNKNNNDKVLAIAKALSTNERLEILNLLQKNSMTVSEISKYFYMSASTATFHLKLLKNAGLINIEMLPSKKGKIQICQINMKSILLYLSTNKPNENKTVIYNMPVGHYTDAKLDFISGFCTKEKQYMFDNGNYFIPERMSAELIWCKSGFVSYSFSNTMPSKKINEIDFSLELCSETLGYYNNWKSDITFSLNGIELLTYTSPGDFGGERYGNLNPDWWKTDNSTQYGLLVQIKINKNNLFLNDKPIISKAEISDFYTSEKFILTIENKKDALYKGGFNIFGKTFGDYPQDILFKITYDN